MAIITALTLMNSGFAGVPFVIVGQNRYVAWGATVNPLDVTDVFQEQLVPDPASPSGFSSVYQGRTEPVIPIPETFRYNRPGNGTADDVAVAAPGTTVGGAFIPPATLVMPRRNNGPIVQLDQATGVALSVQYTGFSGTREVDTFLIWDEARGLEDFLEGLQYFDSGAQNFAYADIHGTIAYLTSSEVPVREDLQGGTVAGAPPWFIRNGRGGNEWLPVQHPQPGQAVPFEILPFDEMPKVINPPAGWFVNANNDPAGTALDNDPLNQLRPGSAVHASGFTLTLDRFGYFHRPQVGWLGTTTMPPALAALVADLGRGCAPCVFPPESRPYEVHLTLARKLSRDPGRPAVIPIEWRVERFALVESVRTDDGLRYVPLRFWEL